MNILLAAAPPAVDVDSTLTKVGALLAVILTLVLIVVAIKTVWQNYGSGDISGSASSLGVVAIGLVIAALGAGAGLALAYGQAFLTAITKLISA